MSSPNQARRWTAPKISPAVAIMVALPLAIGEGFFLCVTGQGYPVRVVLVMAAAFTAYVTLIKAMMERLKGRRAPMAIPALAGLVLSLSSIMVAKQFTLHLLAIWGASSALALWIFVRAVARDRLLQLHAVLDSRHKQRTKLEKEP